MNSICASVLFVVIGGMAMFAQAQDAAKDISVMPATLPVAVIVQDMKRSLPFYSELLGQKVKTSSPSYVTFEKGFSLWQADRASESIGDGIRHRLAQNGGGFELVFESEQIEAIQARLDKAGVKFIHKVREQPWGQRVVRFYDPDGYMLEVGEPMDMVVRRLLKQGISAEDVAKKTVMPIDVVRKIAAEK